MTILSLAIDPISDLGKAHLNLTKARKVLCDLETAGSVMVDNLLVSQYFQGQKY